MKDKTQGIHASSNFILMYYMKNNPADGAKRSRKFKTKTVRRRHSTFALKTILNYVN